MCPDETLKQWNVLLTIENYRYFCHKIYCSWQHTSRKENRGRRRQKKLFQTSVNFFRYLVILTWTRARKKGSFHFLWLVMIEKKGNMCSLGYHNIPGTIYQSSFTQKRHRGRRLTTRTSSPRLFWRGFLIYGTVHSCRGWSLKFFQVWQPFFPEPPPQFFMRYFLLHFYYQIFLAKFCNTQKRFIIICELVWRTI